MRNEPRRASYICVGFWPIPDISAFFAGTATITVPKDECAWRGNGKETPQLEGSVDRLSCRASRVSRDLLRHNASNSGRFHA